MGMPSSLKCDTVRAGPTQDERFKSGNMDFSILGFFVVLVVVIFKNIYNGMVQ